MKKSVLFVHLILCILSITSFVAEAQIPSYVPSNGLVGWWPFNGNANDESGNGNNGTVNGATLTTDRFGNAGKAYSFNGNGNFISIANSNSLTPQNITMSVWYMVDSSFTSGNLNLLSKMNHSIANYFAYAMGLDSLTLKKGVGYSYIGCSTSSGVGGDGAKKVSASSKGVWYMLASSITNTGLITLYLNGNLIYQKQGNVFNPCNNALSELRFGHWWNGDNQWFNGELDDIGIWNRALTQQEITALYNAQPCTPQIVYIHDTLYQAPPCLPNYVPTNGLVGWWPFCGNANDESGNGNNGAVNGATLTTDRFGNTGKAYSFDGFNDTIRVPVQQNNVLTYSVSAWVKTLDGGPIVSGRGLNNQTGLTLHMHNSATAPFNIGQIIYVADGSPVSIGKMTSLNYNDSSWHQIVGVFSSVPGPVLATYFDIFVDGNYVSQSIYTAYSASSPIYNGTDLLFGAHQVWANGGGVFKGQLDDIGIWNRALTQQEITALYTGSPCTQMITLYDTIHTYDTITTLVHTYDTIPVYDTIHIAVTDTLIINANLTGVNPPNNYNIVKVYPNPAKDFLILNFGPNWSSMSGYQVTITNITGQQVYNGNVINQVINLSLNSWGGYGTYTLTIRDTQGNVKEVKKIVLQ